MHCNYGWTALPLTASEKVLSKSFNNFEFQISDSVHGKSSRYSREALENRLTLFQDH